MEWSELSGEQSVRGLLQFSRYMPLLLEADSWGTGIVWELTVRGTFAVQSLSQAMIGEDPADWEDLVRAVVNCSVCISDSATVTCICCL
jgi:hypothetical protein